MTDSHATQRLTCEVEAPPALVWAAYAYADVEDRCAWSVSDGEDLIEPERRLLCSETVHGGGRLLAVAMVLWELEDLAGRTGLSVVDQVTSLVGQAMIDGHHHGHEKTLDQLARWVQEP